MTLTAGQSEFTNPVGHFSWQNYFGDAWNVFDFVIVLGSFIDIIYTEVNVSISTGRAEK